MSSDTADSLAQAMMRFLQSCGVPRQQLPTPPNTPDTPRDTDASMAQLPYLWQLIQAQIQKSVTLSARIRPLIAAQLANQGIRVTAIASQLNMSRYTLHKKLKQENQTFEQLLDDVRREQAVGYLKEGNRQLSEVAALLGFSEPSAFSRAFRRWMGISPAAFRAAALA